MMWKDAITYKTTIEICFIYTVYSQGKSPVSHKIFEGSCHASLPTKDLFS